MRIYTEGHSEFPGGCDQCKNPGRVQIWLVSSAGEGTRHGCVQLCISCAEKLAGGLEEITK